MARLVSVLKSVVMMLIVQDPRNVAAMVVAMFVLMPNQVSLLQFKQWAFLYLMHLIIMKIYEQKE